MDLPLLPSFVCGGLSLVSSNSFVLPIIALPDSLESDVPTAYIEVYEFDDHPLSYISRRSTAVPYISRRSSDDSPTFLPRLVRTLLLPEINIPSPPDELNVDFYCFSLFHNALSLAAECTPRVSPPRSSSAPLIGGLDRPTEPIDDDRLCHFIMDVHLLVGEAEINHCYDFFVYTSTFCRDLTCVDALDSKLEKSGKPRRIPWEDWGVENAAVFCSLSRVDDEMEVDVGWHARGDRVSVVDIDRVWARDQDEDSLRMGDRTWQLRVLDFRPDRVRRAERMKEAKRGGAPALWPRPPPALDRYGRIVLPIVKRTTNDEYATPAGYCGPYFFKEWPIRAELPYVETILDRELDAVWVDVEMDGEHLVINRSEVSSCASAARGFLTNETARRTMKRALCRLRYSLCDRLS